MPTIPIMHATERPTDRQRMTSLVLLFLINLLNYMDRMSIAGVLSIKDPIKAGFLHDLSFTQGGLLQTCFVITFMLLAPVFGYLGDRHSRRFIICCGVVFWSMATFFCSFTTSYSQLIICRALVGVGEASYATIAPTIIADLYADDARTAALSLFYVGIPLGGALGYLGGLIGSLYGFRWAFRITPGIGVLLALTSHFLLVEPARGASEGGVGLTTKEKGLRAFWQDSLKCFKVPSFTASTIGFTAVTFATGALGLWGPKFIVDVTQGTPYESSTEDVSIILGAITAINGVTGTLAGAWIARTLSKYTERAEPMVCLIGMVMSLPTCGPALFLFKVNAYTAWALFYVAMFGLCLNWALVAVILLSVIPPQRRSIGEAIQILTSHILGDALSPYLVGALSDVLVARGVSPGTSLAISLETCMVGAITGAVCFSVTAYYYPRDKENMLKSIIASTYQPVALESNSSTYLGNSDDTTGLIDRTQ